MRRDKILLTTGLVASAGLAAVTYLFGFGLIVSFAVLVVLAALSRAAIYLYFERFLAFKTFEDFKSGRILHECISCGVCCRLKVNLTKQDVERILKYSGERGVKEIVMERSGSRYWLKRNSGQCYFLAHADRTPRCQVYSIRPVACRLFPLIPTGDRLRVDPLCPGFNKKNGMTFRQFLRTQEVGPHVRKAFGDFQRSDSLTRRASEPVPSRRASSK